MAGNARGGSPWLLDASAPVPVGALVAGFVIALLVMAPFPRRRVFRRSRPDVRGRRSGRHRVRRLWGSRGSRDAPQRPHPGRGELREPLARRIGLARYHPNGNSTRRSVTVGRPPSGSGPVPSEASALVMLPGGGFVVGGTFDPNGSRPLPSRWPGSTRTAVSTRLREQRAGRRGPRGDSWYLNDLVRQTNGKLVAGGEVDSEGPDGFPPSFGLARFDAVAPSMRRTGTWAGRDALPDRHRRTGRFQSAARARA